MFKKDPIMRYKIEKMLEVSSVIGVRVRLLSKFRQIFYVNTFLWRPENRKTWRIFFCSESKLAKYNKVVTPESAAAAIF